MNKFGLSQNSENLSRIRLAEQEQRLILHNNLIQRILKLRDKLSCTTSLTEIATKIDELEQNIYGGIDLEEIEAEIIVIEKIVGLHFHNLLSFMFFEELELPQSKTSKAIHQVRQSNLAEQV
jgi:hypothetical protein